MFTRFYKPHLLITSLFSLVLIVSACISAPTGQPVPTNQTLDPSRPAVSTGPAESSQTPFQAVPSTPLPGSTPSPIPASQLEIDPAELSGLQLQFWHSWPESVAAKTEELVVRFNQENTWGITVAASPAPSPDDLADLVFQSLEEDAPPDILAAYPHQALAWDAVNPLADLNPFVADPIWGYEAASQDDFYPALWEQALLGDRRFGLPALMSGQMLLYNQTWAGALGFDSPPDTPDSFRQQACAAAQAVRQDDDPANDGGGGYMISLDYAAMLGWIDAFDGEVTGARGYTFDTQQSQTAFTFLRNLYDEGCAFVSEGRSLEDDFAQRQALFTTASLAGLPYQEQAFSRAGSSDRWVPLAFPSPAGEPSAVAYGSSYVLFAASPARELGAWLFVKWMLEAENQAALALVSSTFPTRQQAAQILESQAAGSPQYQAALALLPLLEPEPAMASWGTVRWALQDASTQLFRSYFTVSQVPELVDFLDETAAEFEKQDAGQ